VRRPIGQEHPGLAVQVTAALRSRRRQGDEGVARLGSDGSAWRRRLLHGRKVRARPGRAGRGKRQGSRWSAPSYERP